MRPKPKQIITIDSQSDIDSSSSHQSMEMQQEYQNMSLRSPDQQDMLQKFNNSSFFLATDSLLKYANKINEFIEFRQKNVLFIFGPSGCGKGCLVRKVLQHSKIRYQILEERQIQQDKIQPLGEIILESLGKMNSAWPYICYDFPITLQKWNASEVRNFKAKFSQQIKKTMTKTIFVLNEQIYNSFYVLNERVNSDENLNNRQNVSVIKMQKFGINEMKKLLKGFYEHEKLHSYVGLGKEFLDEIVQLANGDIRKALNLLYMRGIQDKGFKIRAYQMKKVQKYESEKKRRQPFVNEKTSLNSFSKRIVSQDQQESVSRWNNSQPLSQSSSLSEIQMYTNTVPTKRPKIVSKLTVPDHSRFLNYKRQDESRCTLYHGLGKLLYGKRLNVKQIPKNKKDVSCYYTEQQIKELNPPFYFDPVLLFQHLRVDFDVAARLLQENYLERYGKIKDVKKMSHIFCMDDSLFSYLDIVQNQQVMDLKIMLVTWGIIVYNKNSRTDNMGFRKISKSECTNIDRKVKEKKRLLKVYFPENNLSDLIKFAHLTRNKMPNSLLNDTIFNQSLSHYFRTKVDDHTKTFKPQDDEQMETLMKMNTNEIEDKLRDNRRRIEKKKKDMEALFIQMADQDEEIDQIQDSDEIAQLN